MSTTIHHDADKETKKGSFGYSDWFLYKFMFSYIIPYKREVIITLSYMLLVSIFTIYGPILLQRAVDNFTLTETISPYGIKPLDDIAVIIIDFFSLNYPSINPLWVEIAIFAISYLFVQGLIFFFSYRQFLIIGSVGLKATIKIRHDLFEHLQELDMSYHDNNEVGRIMSRTTTDVEAIRQFLGGSIVQNVLNIFTVIAVAIVIISIDPILSLVSFSLVLPILFISSLARKYSRPRRKEARRTNSVLMANLGESIAGIKVTKGQNRELENQKIFANYNQDRKDAMIRAMSLNIIFFSSMLFFSTLGVALLVLVGGMRYLAGAITIGILLAFLNYNAIMFRPIVILGNFYEQLQDALTGAERIYALLDTETKVPWNKNYPSLDFIEGNVQFNELKFEYFPGNPIYDNFNLSVQSGKKIALVGHTGAGKSTIVNILSRMYEYQNGSLLIDGVDIQQVSLPSFRKQIAIVPQDFFLFSFSVRENLQLGSPDATKEEMWDALETVGLANEIRKLENGLETPLQERGARLSIGQGQLLVFAAVLLANPRILVLDEATSSVDVFTELKIQEAIKKLMKGRTTFIIAHRLSTIREADSIIYIDKGKIIEKGTHEELIDRKGQYYKLVKSQIELAEIVV
ncbi:MAG: ABC transporter ATP-binding protein [Candidatus Hodarchaeales archaeon]|jgi:ATP-binding cassette subfamily B protein